MADLSRTAIVSWVNNLCALQVKRVEDCGTGAAYAQILDSIYGDIPLHKVKFDAVAQHEYLSNYRVLQNAFLKHKIDKPLDPMAMSRCKMIENLEFLQWLKRFWDANYPGGDYDALGRRNGAPTMTAAAARETNASRDPANQRARMTASSSRTSTPSTTGGASRAARPMDASSGAGARVTSAGASSAELLRLKNEVEALNVEVQEVDKERSFYYGKLRDIEIMIAGKLEEFPEDDAAEIPEKDKTYVETLKEIQAILYQTEEGFEVPEGALEDDLQQASLNDTPAADEIF